MDIIQKRAHRITNPALSVSRYLDPSPPISSRYQVGDLFHQILYTSNTVYYTLQLPTGPVGYVDPLTTRTISNVIAILPLSYPCSIPTISVSHPYPNISCLHPSPIPILPLCPIPVPCPCPIRIVSLPYLYPRGSQILVFLYLEILQVCGQIRVSRWSGVFYGPIACRLAQEYQTAA